MTFEVTLAIRVPQLSDRIDAALVAERLSQVGGDLSGWTRERDRNPAQAKFNFDTERRCDCFLAVALEISGVSIVSPEQQPSCTVPLAEPATTTLPISESQQMTATAKAEAQSQPRSEANILAAITRQSLPDIVSPPWADEMEGVILNYIAQRPGLELTELQVQCAEEQCVIFLAGSSIPIYEMGFDVFASDHGFKSAVIQSMDGGPNRFVYLRR